MPTDLESEYDLHFGTPGEGAEGEEDLDTPRLRRLSEAVVTGTDWTTETILRQLERGNIQLDPDFQRRDAWRGPRKSKFIESLIVGLPVPQLVLAENKRKRGSYIVIDGKQRLLSPRQFAAKGGDSEYTQLKLETLTLRSDLNGKSLEDFENNPDRADDLRAFQNQPVRTVVIKGWPDEEVLYLIFLRLNTGSVQLSPQELRQALHPGPFVKYVDKTSGDSEGLHKIFKTSEPDFRMRDAELLVRYFALRNFLKDYRGNLKSFLDVTCKTLNDQWNERRSDIEEEEAEFEAAMAATFKIFGEANAFRKWDGTRYQARFNRAIFDVMVFYFCDSRIRKRAIARKAKVQSRFQRLCQSDRMFARFVESTTKSLEATAGRLRIWGESLQKELGVSIQIPELRQNRIHI